MVKVRVKVWDRLKTKTASYQFNSIQGALLAWETYVNIAKASEVDNIQKWNKQ